LSARQTWKTARNSANQFLETSKCRAACEGEKSSQEHFDKESTPVETVKKQPKHKERNRRHAEIA
jgi:hypothetical protein